MNHSRGALTAPISRKRKERDEDFFKHPINSRVNKKQMQPPPFHRNTTSLKQKPSEPDLSNRLLAGYLAHEFLTQGTLLGQKFDPARVEADPNTKAAPTQAANGGSSAGTKKAYTEVARLVKADGAHIAGIVNPTELARWINQI